MGKILFVYNMTLSYENICYLNKQDGWSAILRNLNVPYHFDLINDYYDNEDASNIDEDDDDGDQNEDAGCWQGRVVG